MTSYLSLTVIATIVVVLYHKRRSRRNFIADIQGPSSSSFLTGNLGEWLRAEAGEIESKWFAEYGNVVRFKAPFGEDRLLISDPGAVHHILSSCRWGSPEERHIRARFLTGEYFPKDVLVSSLYTVRSVLASVLWLNVALGDDHKRHQKIMNPAFGGPETKALVPIFFEAASALTDKWRDMLSDSTFKDHSKVMNVPEWTSRATLDAIGHAGFNYDFGAMDNRTNRLSAAYHNLLADMFSTPSDGMLIMTALCSWIPASVMSWILEHSSNPRLVRGRATRVVSKEVAENLVERLEDDPCSRSRDIMSLLVKANMSENAKSGMSREELLAQMQIMFLAGHDTSANTLTWMLLELSRHPTVQDRLRSEIRLKERQNVAEGRSSFTANDLESMPYLNAVVKESLRFDPVISYLERMSMTEDVAPLSESIQTRSRKEIREVCVSKGQKVYISVTEYHRHKTIFGADAHLYRPERWLEAEPAGLKDASVGVYSNLMSFSGGVRSCIGWRFAVYEIEAFLVELISSL
ncbi:hypothetical protein V5O48_008409 [Marasmius crinis-equi]|uniref:Cytochrome P450 n=1 Tax=Marasmius crinis-equi TaxID=585013 RepID=A0ABR3FE09_9AGAR